VWLFLWFLNILFHTSRLSLDLFKVFLGNGESSSRGDELISGFDLSASRNESAVRTFGDDSSFSSVLLELLSGELGESPVLRDDDLLLSREFELGSSETFENSSSVLFFASDGEEDLSNSDTSSHTARLSEGSSHTGLKSISSGARKHFVNSENVVRVASDSQMERVFSADLGDVLVGADTGGLKSFGGDLLSFVGN